MVGGTETTIDAEDYPTVEHYRWRSMQGYARANVYGTATNKRTTMFMHRLLLAPPAILDIDHIDGNPGNNRRSNLRLATRQQNAGNSKKRAGSSQYKGVNWFKQHQKWHAQIGLNGHKKHLGLFDNEADAARAYNTAATEHFGEYAKLNFIEEAA